MSGRPSTLAETVERGATGAAVTLARKSAARWSLALSNGASHGLELQLDDNWLLFIERPDTRVLPISSETFWVALRQNAASPTEVKIAVTPAKRLSLRSELLLGDEANAEQRVAAVIESFQQTWEDRLPLTPAPPADWVVEVERRCEESGWRCVRRSSGRLTVALETTPALQATLTPVGVGVRLSVEAAAFSEASAASRAAAAALALEISGRVRLVRAATDESQTRIIFEAVFPVVPGADELAAAFSGLSVAVSLTADALGALQHADVARDYLAIRGWSILRSPAPEDRPAVIPNQQPEPESTNI